MAWIAIIKRLLTALPWLHFDFIDKFRPLWKDTWLLLGGLAYTWYTLPYILTNLCAPLIALAVIGPWTMSEAAKQELSRVHEAWEGVREPESEEATEPPSDVYQYTSTLLKLGFLSLQRNVSYLWAGLRTHILPEDGALEPLIGAFLCAGALVEFSSEIIQVYNISSQFHHLDFVNMQWIFMMCTYPFLLLVLIVLYSWAGVALWRRTDFGRTIATWALICMLLYDVAVLFYEVIGTLSSPHHDLYPSSAVWTSVSLMFRLLAGMAEPALLLIFLTVYKPKQSIELVECEVEEQIV